MTIKIDKGVPVPAKYNGLGRAPKYPLRSMDVGDSFFVDGLDRDIVGRNKLSSACSAMGKKLGMKFCVMKVDGGARVWRIS